MSTTTRDYAAEYLAARKAVRAPGIDITERGKAERAAGRIATAADRAGVRIDEIALDERARVELYG